jgi:hypothetical protein
MSTSNLGKRKRRKDIHNESLFEPTMSTAASTEPITTTTTTPPVYFQPIFKSENLFMKLSERQHFDTMFQDNLQQVQKRFQISDAPLEIELRLGTWNPMNGNFKVGVSKDYMQNVMESAFAWSKKNNGVWVDWSQSRDAFYKISNGMQIRTETSVSSDFKVNIKHIWKQKLFDSDFYENNNIGARLAYNREINISSIYNIPLIIIPDFVRLKQRKSLVWTEPSSNLQFHCDFTLSWHGKSFLEADAMQAIRNLPQYEIEFEISNVDNAQNITNTVLEKWKQFINEILHFQSPLDSWSVVQSKKITYEQQHISTGMSTAVETSKKRRI